MSSATYYLQNTNGPGNGCSLTSRLTSIILDSDVGNSSFLLKVNGVNGMYVDKFGNTGLNNTNPTAQLEIASNNGSCLRLRHGVSNLSSSIFVDTSGNLLLNPSSEVIVNGYVDIRSPGLKLNSTLVEATAEELNYVHTTIGVAQPSKALVLDSEKNVSSVNSIQLITPLSATSGGTGQLSYSVGDILVADSPTTLTKLPANGNSGDTLTIDNTNPNKIVWSVGVLSKYVNMSNPKHISSKTYSIAFLHAKNSNGTNNIILGSQTINGSTSGLNGNACSSNLSGTVYPAPSSTSLAGVGSVFTSSFIEGDIITCVSDTSESRKIVSINSNTSLVIDSPFTLLNTWSLNGSASIATTQVKYGTRALALPNSTTAFATLTKGKEKNISSSGWTVELYARFNSTAANAVVMRTGNAFFLAVNLLYNLIGSDFITVSLGNNGTSYNIVSAKAGTQAIVANTWYHIAIVFTGSDYVLYVNGVGSIIATSAIILPSTAFDSLVFGANGTTSMNGYIDEVRVSNQARYSTNFSPPTAPFIEDSYTISLQHFDSTTIATSDAMTLNRQLSYYRGGEYGISYLYAINNPISPAYILSNRDRTKPLVDLPAGYNASDAVPLNFYISHTSPLTKTYKLVENRFSIVPSFVIVNNATNTSPITYDLSRIIPYECTHVELLLTHVHVGTAASGVYIGSTGTNAADQLYLATNVAGSQQLVVGSMVLDNSRSVVAYFSAVASTSSYSLQLVGYSVNHY